MPRPKRLLEGRSIVELENRCWGNDFFLICFFSIIWDIKKCPIPMAHVETYQTGKLGQKRPIGGVKIQRYQKTVKVDNKKD